MPTRGQMGKIHTNFLFLSLYLSLLVICIHCHVVGLQQWLS